METNLTENVEWTRCTLEFFFLQALHAGLKNIISFHPEILYFRMLKLMVFFPETRSFFF